MQDANRYTTISIPIELNEKIKEKIKGTGFHSVSSYVTFILRQIISETPKEAAKEAKESEVFSKEDEEKVKERLRNLGYLE